MRVYIVRMNYFKKAHALCDVELFQDDLFLFKLLHSKQYNAIFSPACLKETGLISHNTHQQPSKLALWGTTVIKGIWEEGREKSEEGGIFNHHVTGDYAHRVGTKSRYLVLNFVM